MNADAPPITLFRIEAIGCVVLPVSLLLTEVDVLVSDEPNKACMASTHPTHTKSTRRVSKMLKKIVAHNQRDWTVFAFGAPVTSNMLIGALLSIGEPEPFHCRSRNFFSISQNTTSASVSPKLVVFVYVYLCRFCVLLDRVQPVDVKNQLLTAYNRPEATANRKRSLPFSPPITNTFLTIQYG